MESLHYAEYIKACEVCMKAYKTFVKAEKAYELCEAKYKGGAYNKHHLKVWKAYVDAKIAYTELEEARDKIYHYTFLGG